METKRLKYGIRTCTECNKLFGARLYNQLTCSIVCHDLRKKRILKKYNREVKGYKPWRYCACGRAIGHKNLTSTCERCQAAEREKRKQQLPWVRCYWCDFTYRGQACPNCQRPYDKDKQKERSKRDSKTLPRKKFNPSINKFDDKQIRKQIRKWMKDRGVKTYFNNKEM